MRDSSVAQSTEGASAVPASVAAPPSAAAGADLARRAVQQQRAVGGRRDDRQPGRSQHDEPVVARKRGRRLAVQRAPLADPAPAIGVPGDRAIGCARAVVEGPAERLVFQVVAHGQERHRRIQRVRRRDQERVEGPEQIQPRAVEQIAMIGQAGQQRVDAGRQVAGAQAVQPQQHRQPRAPRTVRRQVVGRRRPARVLLRARLTGLLLIVGARRLDLRLLGARGAVVRAARRARRSTPAGRRPAEREIGDLRRVEPGDLDVDRPLEGAHADAQRGHRDDQVRQQRQAQREAPTSRHRPSIAGGGKHNQDLRRRDVASRKLERSQGPTLSSCVRGCQTILTVNGSRTTGGAKVSRPRGAANRSAMRRPVVSTRSVAATRLGATRNCGTNAAT